MLLPRRTRAAWPWPGWLLLALAMPVEASDFRGLLSGVLTFAVVAPLALANLVLTLGLGWAGAYRGRRRFARWHAWLGAALPVLGLLASLVDAPSLDGRIGDRLLVNLVALGAALLPLAFSSDPSPPPP